MYCKTSVGGGALRNLCLHFHCQYAFKIVFTNLKTFRDFCKNNNLKAEKKSTNHLFKKIILIWKIRNLNTFFFFQKQPFFFYFAHWSNCFRSEISSYLGVFSVNFYLCLVLFYSWLQSKVRNKYSCLNAKLFRIRK